MGTNRVRHDVLVLSAAADDCIDAASGSFVAAQPTKQSAALHRTLQATRRSATQGNQANAPIIRGSVRAASELMLGGRLMYAMGDGAMGDGTGSDARRGEFAIVLLCLVVAPLDLLLWSSD